MRGQMYRMKKQTLAIRVHDGQKLPTSIPAGSEIEVADTLDGDRLLDVRWEGNSVRMFSSDICEYGEPIETTRT